MFLQFRRHVSPAMEVKCRKKGEGLKRGGDDEGVSRARRWSKAEAEERYLGPEGVLMEVTTSGDNSLTHAAPSSNLPNCLKTSKKDTVRKGFNQSKTPRHKTQDTVNRLSSSGSITSKSNSAYPQR